MVATLASAWHSGNVEDKDVPCFWLESTGKYRVVLRRWRRKRPCPAGPAYCLARTPILTLASGEAHIGDGDLWPHNDVRWPQSCPDCRTEYLPSDPHQVCHERIYRTDIGSEMTLSESGPGAMWDAGSAPNANPAYDNRYICVRLPDMTDWYVDGPAVAGDPLSRGWERSGSVPLVSVTPLVKTERWRGALRDGVLKPIPKK